MKVIRQSVLFILVIAAPIYAGPQLPSAGNFPAGADPFAGQRQQNGLSQADRLAQQQFQQQQIQAANKLRREAEQIEAKAAEQEAAIKKLIADRKAKHADLPQEFTTSTDKILRQGRGKKLQEYYKKVHQSTVHVLALLGNPSEIFGDGSAAALAKAKAGFQNIIRTAKAIQSAAIKVTQATPEEAQKAQAIGEFHKELATLLQRSQPSARGIAAVSGSGGDQDGTLRQDIRLWEGFEMDVESDSSETPEVHEVKK